MLKRVISNNEGATHLQDMAAFCYYLSRLLQQVRREAECRFESIVLMDPKVDLNNVLDRQYLSVLREHQTSSSNSSIPLDTLIYSAHLFFYRIIQDTAE